MFHLFTAHAIEFDRLTELASSQYPILPSCFAVVVVAPLCPRRCMYSVICGDILCSRGSSAGCFSSYETMALSSLPPTRIIPMSSLNGLRDLNSPFSIQLCRVLCACFTQQGPRRGEGWGGGFTPLHFWLIKSLLFFYFSKPGLSFTKITTYILLDVSLCTIAEYVYELCRILTNP